MNNVAIIGRPNVGKSALFNRLVGRRIAIVHDQPGITRDRISATTEAHGREFTLWDTGGIAGAGETQLTKEVRAAADRAIREGDVLLFVVDAQDGLTPVDRDLAQTLRRAGKPVVLVVNKIDDPRHEPQAADFDSLGFVHSHLVSSAHGRGLTDLLSTLTGLLPSQDGATVPSPGRPLQIAILGRPNAGKSSLSNALVGDQRTIVSELPGTTRDAVDIRIVHHEREYALIDTAGIRARSKHSSSVEVFSVMRAEKTVARADLCLLVVDLSAGVTAQDRHIAGLIQKAHKACVIVLNKWDLISAQGRARELMAEVITTAQSELFFVNYAPVLVTSAQTGAYAGRIWKVVERVRRGAQFHIGTGKLNRALQDAFAGNPPPMVRGKRLKLLYATQAASPDRAQLPPPEIVLFVNSARLLHATYARFLEGRIREIAPYPGLPIILSLRARSPEEDHRSHSGRAAAPPSRSTRPRK